MHDADSIFTLQNGEHRKRILMISDDGFSRKQCWIEGVGGSDGPFNHYFFGFFDIPYQRLLCFHEDENLLFSQEYFDYENNFDCYSNGWNPTSIKEGSSNDITIYPNPVKDMLSIDVAFNETFGLSIINQFGQKILTKSLSGKKNQINTNSLPSGIYFISISSNNRFYNFKFLKS